MDEKTLTTLKASIEHWRKNSVATNLDDTSVGPCDCALCGVFNTSHNSSCVGCPIREFTEQPHCQDTPYIMAEEAWFNWQHCLAFDDEPELVADQLMKEFHSAAKVELTFLESLLPKENEHE